MILIKNYLSPSEWRKLHFSYPNILNFSGRDTLSPLIEMNYKEAM